jgi:hypothetical protein
VLAGVFATKPGAAVARGAYRQYGQGRTW